MKIPYFTLRLLTVLCYFLPFIFFLSTCTTDSTSKVAYNKQDALANEIERNDNKLHSFDSLFENIDSTNVYEKLDAIKEHINHLYETSDNISHLKLELNDRLVNPTDYSLSGIGVFMYYDNTPARICIAASILLSVISLLLWRWLTKFNLRLIFLFLNLVTSGVFIYICYSNQITILYGSYLLIFLLFAQLITELSIIRSENN